VNNPLDGLIPQAAASVQSQVIYATVDSINPLVVTVDGDLSPLEISPSTTVDGILVGDRVTCLLKDNELIVTGIIDGAVDYVETFGTGIDTAQSTATAAAQAAAAAAAAAAASQAAANAALTTANGKNKVVRDTVAPVLVSGYTAGDQWWVYSGTNLTALYLFSGTAWVAQTLTNTLISTLDAGKITTGFLDAARINAGAITASHLASDSIDGKVITGATLQTSKVAADKRVIIDSTGFSATNGMMAGGVTIKDGLITASAGGGASVMMGASVQGVLCHGELDQSYWNASLEATSGSGHVPLVRLYSNSGPLSYTQHTTTLAPTALTADQAFVVTAPGVSVSSSAGYRVDANGGTLALAAAQGVVVSGTTLSLSSWSSDTNISSAGLILLSPASGATGVRIANMTTVSNAANCYLWTDGSGRQLIEKTSSLRAIKACIEDIPVRAEQVLRLRPRHWYDKQDVRNAGLDPEAATSDECVTAGLKRIPGFVAEEVEEVLPLFCAYDGSGLSGVSYDRITAGLLVVAQAQAKTIADLEGRLAKLEA